VPFCFTCLFLVGCTFGKKNRISYSKFNSEQPSELAKGHINRFEKIQPVSNEDKYTIKI